MCSVSIHRNLHWRHFEIKTFSERQKVRNKECLLLISLQVFLSNFLYFIKLMLSKLLTFLYFPGTISDSKLKFELILMCFPPKKKFNL